MKSSDKICRCPFCGSPAQLCRIVVPDLSGRIHNARDHVAYHVECTAFGTRRCPIGVHWQSKQSAIKAWNQRAP